MQAAIFAYNTLSPSQEVQIALLADVHVALAVKNSFVLHVVLESCCLMLDAMPTELRSMT